MDDEIDVCGDDEDVEPGLRKGEEIDADDRTSEEQGEIEETGLKRDYPLDRASKEKKRAILDSRLMFTSDVYKVLLEFLRSRKKKKLKLKNLTDWAKRLRESGMKGSLSFLNRVLHSCQHKLDIKYSDGNFFLYHKRSGKLIAAKDHMPRIIMEAHTGTGLFQNYSKAKDNGTNQHHSLSKTINLLQSLFTMGDKGFGFSRAHIEEVILSCPNCSPASAGSNATSTGIRIVERRLQDILCEQTQLTVKDSPLSMAVCGPSKNSVWYDQQGLADEKVLFKKLIGVITEIGIEVQKTIQGDPVAKERLLTKICCGEKLIHDMKARTKITLESGCLSMAQFLDSYNELESEYRDIGRLDLFIYDMNLLLFLYKFSNPETLMDKINSCVQALRAKKSCNLKFYA